MPWMLQCEKDTPGISQSCLQFQPFLWWQQSVTSVPRTSLNWSLWTQILPMNSWSDPRWTALWCVSEIWIATTSVIRNRTTDATGLQLDQPFNSRSHNDVIKWKHPPRYWPFVRGIHRSPVNSPHKGQWRGAFMLSLNCAWINRWVKKSWGWWFETLSRPLWRHCNALEEPWLGPNHKLRVVYK